jgi:hypothetical protein
VSLRRIRAATRLLGAVALALVEYVAVGVASTMASEDTLADRHARAEEAKRLARERVAQG